MYAHTHMHTHTQVHTYTCTHTHTYMYTHPHTYTHAHTQHTHAHTHTGTHTYTHNTQMHTGTRECTHKHNDITSFPFYPLVKEVIHQTHMYTHRFGENSLQKCVLRRDKVMSPSAEGTLTLKWLE